MKILITGGAGYIGSVLTSNLLHLGHEVLVIDNFYYNQFSLSQCFIDKKFSLINQDARNIDKFSDLLPEFEIIIPLAALVGAPICSKFPKEAYEVNQFAVEKLVEKLENHQKIIMPVSNSGYGIGLKDKFCDENSPLNPISDYGKSKVNAEKIIMDRENSISLRLATVFGMSQRMRYDLMVNDFVFRAFFDKYLLIFEGGFRRNFIHIRDVVSAFIHCIENFNSMKSNIYNVGLDSANITKIELAHKIKSYLPDTQVIEADIGEDPDKRDYNVSNAKFYKTGFSCSYSLDDGIIELIKGMSTFPKSNFKNI